VVNRAEHPSLDRETDADPGTSFAGRDADAARSSEKRLSSVAAAMALLKAFSEDEIDIGVSTLAKRLGMAKSTVHRLATTLVSEGMLEQNPENGKYRLGIALFGLGALVRRRMDVSTEAKPYLFDLRETTGETVHLAILDRADIMYVYNLESTQAIRMRSDIGVRKPAHCTAEGLAMLAFQPGSLIDDIVARGLRRAPPRPTRIRSGCARCLRPCGSAVMRSRTRRAKPACGAWRRRSGTLRATSLPPSASPGPCSGFPTTCWPRSRRMW
jgi:IclR family transcriptional regulator, KDG regulon repressor